MWNCQINTSEHTQTELLLLSRSHEVSAHSANKRGAKSGKKRAKAFSPLSPEFWNTGNAFRRDRKLLLLISHRFAVFPPVPGVFVVGAALRFSQLWWNVQLWNPRGLRPPGPPWACGLPWPTIKHWNVHRHIHTSTEARHQAYTPSSSHETCRAGHDGKENITCTSQGDKNHFDIWVGQVVFKGCVL